MNKVIVISSFLLTFAGRLMQVSQLQANMVSSAAPFEPYGCAWSLFSSLSYGLACMLVVLAITNNMQKSSTTILALVPAATLLTADFAKPSRFEDGTYLDHAIHFVGTVESNRLAVSRLQPASPPALQLLLSNSSKTKSVFSE